MTAPFWPSMMKRATACAYTDLSAAEFEREIFAGRLPAPVEFGNHPHWHKDEIDRYLARIANPANDWRSRTKLYGKG